MKMVNVQGNYIHILTGSGGETASYSLGDALRLLEQLPAAVEELRVKLWTDAEERRKRAEDDLKKYAK